MPIVRDTGSEAAGWSPRPRRIRCCVSASWAAWLKWKPRPRARARWARPPPRLPRGAVALELLLRSSAEDIMSCESGVCRGSSSSYIVRGRLRCDLWWWLVPLWVKYRASRGAGPLAWCIGRVVVRFEGSLEFRGLIFSGVFGVSVGTVVCFPGTGIILTVLFSLY